MYFAVALRHARLYSFCDFGKENADMKRPVAWLCALALVCTTMFCAPIAFAGKVGEKNGVVLEGEPHNEIIESSKFLIYKFIGDDEYLRNEPSYDQDVKVQPLAKNSFVLHIEDCGDWRLVYVDKKNDWTTGYVESKYLQPINQSGETEFGSRVLKKGCKGDDVKQLQAALILIGFKLPKYGADGGFGSETRNAVRKFQKNHGLSADGIVGSDTYYEIKHCMYETNPRKHYWHDD